MHGNDSKALKAEMSVNMLSGPGDTQRAHLGTLLSAVVM